MKTLITAFLLFFAHSAYSQIDTIKIRKALTCDYTLLVDSSLLNKELVTSHIEIIGSGSVAHNSVRLTAGLYTGNILLINKRTLDLKLQKLCEFVEIEIVPGRNQKKTK